MPSSKYEKKRKRDLDTDTTALDEDSKGIGDKSDHKHKPERSPSKRSRTHRKNDSDEIQGDESISIEESNKLRASLGLAPLAIDDDKVREGENGEKIFVEDGVEIVHKAAKNRKQEREQESLKERVEVQKQRRQVYSKVLKTNRTLAESDSEGEMNDRKDAKTREQLMLAAKKAQELEEMDNEFGISQLIKAEEARIQKHKRVSQDLSAPGLIVGHNIKNFVDGRDTILVLQDKDVLDTNDEILINPNMLDTERLKRNIEAKKRQSRYQDEDEVDEYGQVKKPEILAKYDDGVDGEHKKKEFFKLDMTGSYDFDSEEREAELKKKLFFENKMLQSAEGAKYKLATEFYTEEEMLKFRRPKKRQKKALKVSDIMPITEEEANQEKILREKKLKARRDQASGGNRSWNELKEVEAEAEAKAKEKEDGEIQDEPMEQNSKPELTTYGPEPEKWKPAPASVNIEMLNSLTKKREDNEQSDEDEFPGSTNLMGVVIDDDADDELNAALSKTRQQRLKETCREQPKTTFSKLESDEEDDAFASHNENRIIFDSTTEQYKSIGDTSYDASDALPVKEKRDEKSHESKRHKKSKSRRKDESKKTKMSEPMDEDRKGSQSPLYAANILEEKDVTKGVAAMLKLAGEKGYLESSSRKNMMNSSLKQMLESKRFSKVEQGRYDIEDKTLRKLERMGTMGQGPLRSFPEKKDYKPQIEISYADVKGRGMPAKEAFRVLSWKFHGKGPGKKQVEKHRAKLEKKERLKKMNSSDTPLGTLSKQIKKQEQFQTPYLILSGSGRDGAPLKKD